ncbi:MAG: DUF45 domain-containing protein [Victivallales bacterium]|nr:DUF45 domain-containing protein [Victivallales bacterium]
MTGYEIELSGEKVVLQVVRNRRCRRMGLVMGRDGLRLTLPQSCSERQAKAFVAANESWIRKHLAERRRQVDSLPVLEDGGKIPFKGECFEVQLRREYGGVEFDGRVFRIADYPGSRRSLARWYMRQAADLLLDMLRAGRADECSAPKVFRLRDLTSRWGSCSGSGSVSLNWRLIMAPERVFEYVLLHELVHFEVNSHNRAFWQALGRILPGYKEPRQWLSRNGHILMGFPEPSKIPGMVRIVRPSS